MAGITRVTHTVRCRSSDNPQIYADVQVLDAIAMVKPNGDEIGFLVTHNFSGVSLNVAIVDNTGDGNATGNPGFCSRLSHMERVTSQTDPTQFCDVEILDGFALQPPDVESGDGPGTENDDQTLDGFIDSGDVGGAQHAFITQSTKAVPYIVDKVGLGLGVPYNSNATTRSAHVNMVTDDGDTDDKTQFSDGIEDTIPPTKHPYVATLKTDAMAFVTSNGNTICLIAPPSGINDNDTTKYVTDPFTGEENSPPDNTDPNIYVKFPKGNDAIPSFGANLGTDPISTQTGKAGPINQGIFWWIKKISPIPRPWFWYNPVTTYKAFSFFGSPPESTAVKWGYRGFQLLNTFPVIWILGVFGQYPPIPMGSYGSPSLDLCATGGSWDTTGELPNGAVGVGGGIFAPFGVLPMIDPPIPEGTYKNALPNIWQLTGVPQPNLANPNMAWDQIRNPYLWPTAALAEQCAQTFESYWNSVADAVNGALPGCAKSADHSPPGAPAFKLGNPPPGWKWKVPWTWPHGPPDPTWFSFQNGIIAELISNDGSCYFPPEVFVPVNVQNMRVDQLDPSEWDTRACISQETGTNIPIFGPPITWELEATGVQAYQLIDGGANPEAIDVAQAQLSEAQLEASLAFGFDIPL